MVFLFTRFSSIGLVRRPTTGFASIFPFRGLATGVRASRRFKNRLKRRKRAAQCSKSCFWGIILHDSANFPRKSVIFVESLIFQLKLQCQFVVLENGQMIHDNYAIARQLRHSRAQSYIYPHFVAQWHPPEPLDEANICSGAGKGLLALHNDVI